jgi:hypothetical protein
MNDKRNTMASACTTSKSVEINLGRSARNAWKECKGVIMPEINAFGDTYSGIGLVWTQGVDVSNQSSLYTTTEYPPSILDECAP